MKALTTLLLSLITLLPALSQKQSVDVGSFSQLSLGIAAEVYLKQGADESVQISCDSDIFEQIEFDLSGDRLSIRKEGKWNWKDGWRKSDVTIWITMKDIEEVAVSGSGNIESEGKLMTNDLRLSVSGSGDMDLDLESDDMDLRISGSGSLTLKGLAEEADAKISGSGRVKAEDLEVQRFKASISGSGSCYITATEEIDANISGSGSVYYAGEPKRVNGKTSGSGKVKKM